ncbi:MAG: hypothetical protein ABR606_11870 [Vicinamibacterales bacterium]
MRGKVWQALFAIATTVILTAPAAAQDMSSADVERLQETVNDIGTDIATLRRRDAAAARTLQSQLDELQEEVIYLKVKQRKERNVPRAAFLDVRDQLENLRGRARGDDGASGAYASTSTAPVGDSRSSSSTSSRSGSSRGTIPVGTELDVRLETALSSNTAQVEDRFEATTEVDLREEGRVLIPAGSRVRGVVSDVKEAGRVERKGSLTLTFDQISVNGRSYPLRATVTEALESGGYKEDAGKIGTGAAVGGIIGGILGGLKGAIAGILIGGGGVVAATEGEDVRLPAGTVLRIRIDQPLTIR